MAELRDEAAIAAAERAMGEWDPNKARCNKNTLEQEESNDGLDSAKPGVGKKSKIEVLA